MNRPDPTTSPGPETAMPVMEHLRDLIQAVRRSAVAVAIGVAAAWFFRERITWLYQRLLAEYIPPENATLVVGKLTDVFSIHMDLAFYGGILLSSPFVLWEAWKFVMPGLYERERRLLAPLFVTGGLFFAAGVCFAYFVALPAAIGFLAEYSLEAELPVKMLITLQGHISFVTTFLIAFGLLAELPLLMVVSCRIGIATPDWFARQRPFAVVILAILAAVLTPPDPVSMVVLLIPLFGLYEGAIVAARLLGRGGRAG